MTAPSPDDLPGLVEAVADELTGWQIGTGYYSLDVSSTDAREMARAAVAAMVEHLGLTEEVAPFCDECGHDAQPACPNWHDTHPRRLVSRWTEVDHGSE